MGQAKHLHDIAATVRILGTKLRSLRSGVELDTRLEREILARLAAAEPILRWQLLRRQAAGAPPPQLSRTSRTQRGLPQL